MPYNISAATKTSGYPATPPELVLVVRPELVAPLRAHLVASPAVAVFPASHALRALDCILKQPPQLVALDRAFAMTARGATLIAAMKADARFESVACRLVAEDEEEQPVLLRHDRTPLETEGAFEPLPRCGTRGAARFPTRAEVVVRIDGEPSRLVNLSATGAQVVCPIRLRPQQRVRLAVTDGQAEARLRGVVAWVAFEPAGGNCQYRAGLVFTDPDAAALDALRQLDGRAHDPGTGDVPPAVEK